MDSHGRVEGDCRGDAAVSLGQKGRRRKRTVATLKSLQPMVRRLVPRPPTPKPTPWGTRRPRLPGLRATPLDRKTPTFGQLGTLEVRLARTPGEVKRAQQIRYQVFYEEMAAQADAFTMATRRDRDQFDALCDHLLVLDHNSVTARPFRKPQPRIVGTYRMLRQEVADGNGGFYSTSEFDVAPLIRRHPDKSFLELGRSCVLKPYRDKRTVELLWHGAWTYVLRHNVDVMFGCASLAGTDPDGCAMALSYLYHNHLAPPEWRVRALPGRYVSMNRMPADAVDAKTALRALPPLIKGYLRLGAYVADGAVLDKQFGTTDVMVVLPVSAISGRYINYYGANATRHA